MDSIREEDIAEERSAKQATNFLHYRKRPNFSMGQ